LAFLIQYNKVKAQMLVTLVPSNIILHHKINQQQKQIRAT